MTEMDTSTNESSSDAPQDTTPTLKSNDGLEVSENGAQQLLQLMIERGYFLHSDPTIEKDEDDNGGIIAQLDCASVDTFEKFQQLSEKQKQIYVKPESSKDLSDTCNKSSQEVTVRDCERNTLVPNNTNSMFYTVNGLAQLIAKELSNVERSDTGRMKVEDVIKLFQVNERYLQETTSLTRNVIIQELGIDVLYDIDRNEIFVTQKYWDDLAAKLRETIEKDGSARVIDLATKHMLPVDVLMDKVIQATAFFTVIRQHNNKVLVSQSYLEQLREKVICTFQSLTKPTMISRICKDHGWDQDLVFKWIGNDKESANDIGGEVHADAIASGSAGVSVGGTAMFVPYVYTQRQQQEVTDFYATNGFITTDIAKRHGALPQQMVQWITEGKENNDSDLATTDVVVLTDESDDPSSTVLLADHICQNLQAAIQECCCSQDSGNNTNDSDSKNNSSTLAHTIDLQEYLPAELVNRPETVLQLLDHVGFKSSSDVSKDSKSSSSSKTKDGVAIFGDGEAMIINQQLIQNITDSVLPPLIEAFAKTEAEKFGDASIESSSSNDLAGDTEESRRKGGGGRKRGKGRKGSRGEKAQETSTATRPHAVGVVPLLQVAGAILKAYPALMPEGTEQEMLERAESIAWNDETDGGDNGNTYDGSNDILLIQFCKKALYTETFKTKCHEAVQAEWKRLQSLKESKASISRKDAAAKVRTVEGSFEDVFVSLCRMIQVSVKFLNFVESSKSTHFDDQAIETLQKETLQGCCADLTSRMTQYVLFKNEEEGGIFSFTKSPINGGVDDNAANGGADNETEAVTPSGLPAYCVPLDTSARRYQGPYLSCPPPREPLQLLRESLSGTIGVSLARQWILCGGGCYLGGVRTSEGDGTTFVRPGNLESFLNHVEENCLYVVDDVLQFVDIGYCPTPLLFLTNCFVILQNLR